MAIKFTIGKKIGAGFAVLIILTTLAFILTVVTLKDSKSKTDTVVGQLAPSVAELKELNLSNDREPMLHNGCSIVQAVISRLEKIWIISSPPNTQSKEKN